MYVPVLIFCHKMGMIIALVDRPMVVPGQGAHAEAARSGAPPRPDDAAGTPAVHCGADRVMRCD